MHPRNRHSGRYDFGSLAKASPDLAAFVSKNPYGEFSIDFADPEAVKILNRALLKDFYGVSRWDIPEGYLCPPIPGRADYLHQLADLLASSRGGAIPRGGSVRVLDIGVGASCIYPLIGHHEYGWSFVGSDTDPVALASAGKILQADGKLMGAVELRLQASPERILEGILLEGEVFDALICNPPFHASLAEAREGSRRKWRGLRRGPERSKRAAQAPLLNFGGQGAELWCPGGEAAFVRRMIEESAGYERRVFWFSALISKEAHLPGILAALKKAGVVESKTLEMAQGQKKSRAVAWTFLTVSQRKTWRTKRWGAG